MTLTLDQIIGILGQIATWVTIHIVYRTLREMEKQRKEAQKPEIIIPKVLVHGYSNETSELQIPVVWRNRELQEGENYTSDKATISLYNIGIGAAKNIKLTWDFDLQNTLKKIQDYCYQNSIPIVVKIENGFLEMKIKEYSYGASISASSDRELGYLMPVSVTSQGLETSLPATFMVLLSVQIYIMIHESNNKEKLSRITHQLSIPTIHLLLTYSDIGGEKYKKEFDVKFSLQTIMYLQEDNALVGRQDITTGIFEFSERTGKSA